MQGEMPSRHGHHPRHSECRRDGERHFAACGAEGTSVIYNAAREPEIVDLQALLRSMGARVNGAGGSIITVEGGAALHGCTHRVIGIASSAPHLPLRRGGGGR